MLTRRRKWKVCRQHDSMECGAACLQMICISLTDKTHLRDLFDKTNFNDVKDQFGPLIPGLFD